MPALPISCDCRRDRGSIYQMESIFQMARPARVYAAVALATSLVSATAGADDRLDLPGIPDAQILEPAYHLDRGTDYAQRSGKGFGGSIGLGAARYHGIDSVIASVAVATGWRNENLLLVDRGELALADTLDETRVLRGRYRTLAEARTDWDAELGAVVAVRGNLEHGDALGLSTARMGAAGGRRDNGDLALDTLVRIGKQGGDFSWVAIGHGDAGATRWYGTPQLDRAEHKALGMGIGQAPLDGELPRGSIELLRARVEHTRIYRPRSGGADVATAAIGAIDSEVREVQVGLGLNDFTLYIDHELLAVIAVDLGWSWLEADAAQGTIADNAFRMRLGTDVEWRDGKDHARRRVGFGLVRAPTATADGQRLAGEWRLEGISSIETSRFILDGRGGISWLQPFAGGAAGEPPVNLLVRYGAQLEAMVKLAGHVEAGAYHANAYEPRVAGDPWASQRRWTTETGFLARWRP